MSTVVLHSTTVAHNLPAIVCQVRPQPLYVYVCVRARARVRVHARMHKYKRITRCVSVGSSVCVLLHVCLYVCVVSIRRTHSTHTTCRYPLLQQRRVRCAKDTARADCAVRVRAVVKQRDPTAKPLRKKKIERMK